MSWNHRVVKDRHGVHTIRETFYDSNGGIYGWLGEPSYPLGETLEELTADLAGFSRALSLPVLDEEELLKAVAGDAS